jgi:hypothetical protein
MATYSFNPTGSTIQSFVVATTSNVVRHGILAGVTINDLIVLNFTRTGGINTNDIFPESTTPGGNTFNSRFFLRSTQLSVSDGTWLQDKTTIINLNYDNTVTGNNVRLLTTNGPTFNAYYSTAGYTNNAGEGYLINSTVTGNLVFEILLLTAPIQVGGVNAGIDDYLADSHSKVDIYNLFSNTANYNVVGNLTFDYNTFFRTTDTGMYSDGTTSPLDRAIAANTYFRWNGTGNISGLNQIPYMIGSNTNVVTNTTYTTSIVIPTTDTIAFTFSSPAGGINCLAYGTKLLTPFGYRLVQDIKEGDLLSTHDGRITTVNKILKRTIISNDELYLIKKDSFGINIPNEDLYLSQHHAIYYNGAFHHPVHTNNKNIIKVDKTCVVQFYHFEVDNYFTDFIIANNMIVETNNSNSELNKICSYVCSQEKCSIRMSGKDVLLDNILQNQSWLQLL